MTTAYVMSPDPTLACGGGDRRARQSRRPPLSRGNPCGSPLRPPPTTLRRSESSGHSLKVIAPEDRRAQQSWRPPLPKGNRWFPVWDPLLRRSARLEGIENLQHRLPRDEARLLPEHHVDLEPASGRALPSCSQPSAPLLSPGRG